MKNSIYSTRARAVVVCVMGFILVLATLLLTSCGKDIIPTPIPTLPVVSTADVTNITTTSITTGGNVSSEGGALVSERGLCWGLTSNPTISDNKLSSGVGPGSFTGTINGLTEGTTYFVRAYAKNSVGTGYGNNVSFTTTAIMYPVTITAGANGIATSPKEVVNGGQFVVTAVPNIGFMTDSIKVNGLNFVLNGNTTYTIMNNLKPPVVYVTFKPDPKWVLSQHPWYTVMEQRRYVNTIPWSTFYPSDKILIEKYEFYQSGNNFKIKTSWPDKGTPVYEYVCTIKDDSLIWSGHRTKIISLDPNNLVLKDLIEYIDFDGKRVPEKDIDVQFFYEPTRSYK